MTPKEAIDYLIDPIGKRDQHDEAIDAAVEALEKQIPEKPDYVSDGWDPEGVGIWDPHCPNCDHNLEDGGEPDHCPNCGQRICWEDE